MEDRPGTNDTLTTRDYWTRYYQESNEGKDIIRRICGKYDFFFDVLVRGCQVEPKNLLEIGAFPGRYLAYLGSRYHLQVTGVDFNPDKAKFGRILKDWGVQGDYVISDFMQYQPDRFFHLVFSNGFIEHFTDFNSVLDKHADLVSPGGGLMIMIPNKRYLRALYGNIVDRANQQVHNLQCMDLSVFKRFAARNNLHVSYLGYYGGFPYKVHQPLKFWQKLVYHPVRFLSISFAGLLGRFPSRFWSGTIIGVFHKST